MNYGIKAGDLVKYYDFSVDNPDVSKPRPAMVLGYDPYQRKYNLMRITSKRNRTEDKDYVLKGEEIRVPKGMRYERDNKETELYGVIKTNNIIQVNRERLTQVLDVFSFRFKKGVLDKYYKLIEKEWFREYADQRCKNHSKIMDFFHEDLIAEKLGYFTNDVENIYDFVRHEEFKIDGIYQLPSNKHGYRYSVLMEHDDHIYEYTISTDKSPSEVSRSWSDTKIARDWLCEDKKFHVLKNDLSVRFVRDPEVTRGYQSLGRFKRGVRENKYEIEI